MVSRTASLAALALLLMASIPQTASPSEERAGAAVLSVVREWSSAELRGYPSIAINDTDGDGTNELLIWGDFEGGARATVYDLPGYDTLWSQGFSGSISFELTDLGRNGSVQLVLREMGGEWENFTVLSGTDFGVLWRSPDLWGSVTYELLEDVDADGELEFVWVNTSMVGSRPEIVVDSRIHIFGAVNYEREWGSPDLGGWVDSLAAENVDGDEPLELLAATSSWSSASSTASLRVYDGASHDLQWELAQPDITSLSVLYAGDADGDGSGEVVVSVDSSNETSDQLSGFRVLSGASGAALRSATLGNYSSAHVADINNDTLQELVATGQVWEDWEWSNYTHYVYSLKSGAVIWCAGPWRLSSSDSTSLSAQELTGDGVMELVLANTTFDMDNHTFGVTYTVLDGRSFARKWASPRFEGWGEGLQSLPLDSDAPWEILVSESWSTGEGADHGVIHVYSTDDFKEEWRSEDLGASLSAVGMDVVNDTRNELLIATYKYDMVNWTPLTRLRVLDTDTHSVLWMSPESPSLDLQPGDLYGAARNEIAMAESRGSYPELSTVLRVYNDTTLAEAWSSEEMWGAADLLFAEDIDGDGRGELVASLSWEDDENRTSTTVLAVWEFSEGPLTLPDLALPEGLTLSEVSPVAGSPLTLTALVSNLGTADSGPFCATFVVDSAPEAHIILELAAGCSTELRFEWRARLGSHRLEVRLDPRDLVTELDESNNNASLSVTVAQRPSPVAVITSPTEGEEFEEGENITFDGRQSVAPGGCELRWTSDLSGPIGTGPLLSAALPVGDHEITLSVMDMTCNRSSLAAVNISVLPPPPPPGEARAVIASPRDGASYIAGEPILFDGSRSQPSERGLPLTYLWSSNLSGALGAEARLVRALSAGQHTISLLVEDSKGRAHLASVAVSVRPVEGPTAIIDSPLEGQVFEANQMVRFDASSSSGEPGSYLTYMWSSNLSGALSAERAFTMRLQPGAHEISLIVRDERGRNASARVNITVKRSMDYPPVVEITHPTEGAVLQGLVLVNGTAWDDAALLGVYVRIDDGAWDATSGGANWSYTWNTSSVENGTHRISVKAIDSLQSSPEVWINVTVANPPRALPPEPGGGEAGGPPLLPIAALVALVALAAVGAARAFSRRRGP
ncbi:MAG: Ig-like domain-containing protein [Thermoplasmatota archaeon]